MARYTGPKRRLERRESMTLFSGDGWRKRPTPPGQHGASRSRPSSYSIQFREKQKLKRIYGVLEKQFRNFYERALQSEGNTGLKLRQLLELRLDNVIFRLGLAKTRMQARQFVSHGHVKVNGSKVNIPSYVCNVNDEVVLDSKIQSTDLYKVIREDMKTVQVPGWLDGTSTGGSVKSEPTTEDMDKSLNEQLVIELYSR